jgi:biotin synthase-related radical SAM superfamily protein
MDGKDYEFKSLQEAQAAVKLHQNNNPLHNPYVAAKPVVEYLVHNDKHMIRYREESEDRIRIHSVNGHAISSDKCAYECQLCGAIYESKEYPNHSFFRTSDPRCATETHYDSNTICGLQEVEKICLCPSIFQESEEREEQQKKLKTQAHFHCICE